MNSTAPIRDADHSAPIEISLFEPRASAISAEPPDLREYRSAAHSLRAGRISRFKTYAILLALSINGIVLLGLTLPEGRPGGSTSQRPHPISVYFVVGPENPKAKPRVSAKANVPAAKKQIAAPYQLVVALASNGPPAEMAATTTTNTSEEAHVLDGAGLKNVCIGLHSGSLSSETARSVTLKIRIFVMTDGRIGQETLDESTGDDELDAVTLQCVQAYGRFKPEVDENDSPIGSWQRLTWTWNTD